MSTNGNDVLPAGAFGIGWSGNQPGCVESLASTNIRWGCTCSLFDTHQKFTVLACLCAAQPARLLPLCYVDHCLLLKACLLCTQGPANAELYEGLLMLQHRGQDSAGMVTLQDSRKFIEHKANGLVKDVFNNTKTMDKLQGMLLTQPSIIT